MILFDKKKSIFLIRLEALFLWNWMYGFREKFIIISVFWLGLSYVEKSPAWFNAYNGNIKKLM